MDILGTALEFRTEAYSEINSKFGVLWKIVEKSVMKNEKIREKFNQLLQIYNLSGLGHEFPDGCVHLALFLKDTAFGGEVMAVGAQDYS